MGLVILLVITTSCDAPIDASHSTTIIHRHGDDISSRHSSLCRGLSCQSYRITAARPFGLPAAGSCRTCSKCLVCVPSHCIRVCSSSPYGFSICSFCSSVRRPVLPATSFLPAPASLWTCLPPPHHAVVT